MIAQRTIAGDAVAALIDEAMLTPKPGLVDGRGNGAHTDLTLELLLRSARVLHATFEELERAASGSALNANLRAELGAIGRAGEARMLRETRGVNTHRGAIWSVGLLVSASALCASRDPLVVACMAGEIARLPDSAAPAGGIRNGARVRAAYRVGGAVAQARDDFPQVTQHALPALRAARARGGSESDARVDALLAVMTALDDTCLLHRGGPPALLAAQRGAQAVLDAGGIGTAEGRDAFVHLERALERFHASPGGAADVLAATLFLDARERG